MNGEFVDSFNDASMAKGIFYEYMRGDDPISPEAREHFPDGFPSILAPLTQFSPEKVRIEVKLLAAKCFEVLQSYTAN